MSPDFWGKITSGSTGPRSLARLMEVRAQVAADRRVQEIMEERLRQDAEANPVAKNSKMTSETISSGKKRNKEL